MLLDKGSVGDMVDVGFLEQDIYLIFRQKLSQHFVKVWMVPVMGKSSGVFVLFSFSGTWKAVAFFSLLLYSRAKTNRTRQAGERPENMMPHPLRGI